MSNKPIDGRRPEWWGEAKRLRAEGMSPAEIGKLLGKSPKLISNLTAGIKSAERQPAEVITVTSPEPRIMEWIRTARSQKKRARVIEIRRLFDGMTIPERAKGEVFKAPAVERKIAELYATGRFTQADFVAALGLTWMIVRRICHNIEPTMVISERGRTGKRRRDRRKESGFTEDFPVAFALDKDFEITL